VPSRVAAALRQDPRVATSAECWAAVERLREVHGLAGANPFMYVETVSPHLNLYPEPLPFLDDDDRRALEPVAFFGSLTPTLQDDPMTGVFRRERGRLRLYVAFGTVVWWYFASAARAALTAIASDTAQLGVEVVVGLGGHCLDAATRTALARPDIRVLEYANQWAALREADVFVTHNGLNSTHEAIFHEVPMISYPLFGDQPALARRCRDLGLATSLADGPRAPVAAGALRAALERLRDDRVGFAARLAMARAWEIQTIAGREAVLDRMLALIGTGSGVAP
jgi:UDP:flavonoid glycosyltransferase YjiC (YdhE family)